MELNKMQMLKQSIVCVTRILHAEFRESFWHQAGGYFSLIQLTTSLGQDKVSNLSIIERKLHDVVYLWPVINGLPKYCSIYVGKTFTVVRPISISLNQELSISQKVTLLSPSCPF